MQTNTSSGRTKFEEKQEGILTLKVRSSKIKSLEFIGKSNMARRHSGGPLVTARKSIESIIESRARIEDGILRATPSNGCDFWKGQSESRGNVLRDLLDDIRADSLRNHRDADNDRRVERKNRVPRDKLSHSRHRYSDNRHDIRRNR
ncbi:hypothetical protein HZH68_014403 [Vespula germanica]|uniref:Uncharacterized protein n=1 Tax=Vespula germanica TaxID=30212 RepID=A0A834JBX8_VESGE|nr:hypothetical protein HZH68_014403 [Vespula germanica]